MKDLNLNPNTELAYLLGLIVGDGSLYHNKKTNHYHITMESTNINQIKNLEKGFKKCFPNLSIWKTSRNKVRFFNNPKYNYFYNNKSYTIGVSSIKLYNFISLFKHTNYYWSIPSFVKKNKQNMYSFLDGIIETEGSFHKDEKYKISISRIHIISKHKINLLRLKELLNKFKIFPTIYKKNNCYSLNINRKKDILSIIKNCPRCKSSVKIKKESNPADQSKEGCDET